MIEAQKGQSNARKLKEKAAGGREKVLVKVWEKNQVEKTVLVTIHASEIETPKLFS